MVPNTVSPDVSLTITIDWLAGTFKEFNDAAETFIRTYASADDVQATTPRNGYTYGQRDGYGVLLYWNSNDNRMGQHAVFGGTTLRNLLEHKEISSLALLSAAIDAGMRISRLDLAKDATGQAFDGEAIYQSLKSRAGGGSTRNVSRIENNMGGQTIYVGSRTSEKFIRIYDKAAETGDFTKQWWRFELETKGEFARLVASALASGEDASSVLDTTSQKMVGQFSGGPLDKFTSSSVVPWGLPKIEKHTDREKWISDQVISAVARHYIDNPNSEAIAAMRRILDHIDKQRKE